MISRWRYHSGESMITRWRHCLNAVMITRWQYCRRAAMITRWHCCISEEMVIGWWMCLTAKNFGLQEENINISNPPGKKAGGGTRERGEIDGEGGRMQCLMQKDTSQLDVCNVDRFTKTSTCRLRFGYDYVCYPTYLGLYKILKVHYPKPKSWLVLFSPIFLSSVYYASFSLPPVCFPRYSSFLPFICESSFRNKLTYIPRNRNDQSLFTRIETNHPEMLFFSEHILFRTSLPKCLYEIDACPTLICLLLLSYRIDLLSFFLPFLSWLFFAPLPC